eukprot:s194_g56.t1
MRLWRLAFGVLGALIFCNSDVERWWKGTELAQASQVAKANCAEHFQPVLISAPGTEEAENNQAACLDFTSRSKSQSYAKPSEGPDEEKSENLQMFPSNVPWIPATPTRSTTYRDTLGPQGDGESAQPLQTLSQTQHLQQKLQIEDGLTAEETKVLEHLRGLQGLDIQLTEQMQLQLDHLLHKEQKAASAKVLSHSQLNKLNKLKGQVASCAKKIHNLDAEWNSFMMKTLDKVKQHAGMYQNCRADMMEQFNGKLAELKMAREEISVASRSLVTQPLEEPTFADPPNVATQLAELQEALTEAGQVGSIDLTDSPMEEANMEESMEGDNKKTSPKGTAMKPFRSAASPTGVAKTHLKTKPDETKPKEKEPKK